MSEGGHKAKSGRWFSAKWWRDHWGIRDRCGSFATIDTITKDECEREQPGGAQRRLHRQLEREHQQHQAKKASKPARAGNREQLREQARQGQHAQQLRAENYARGGGKTERAAFYGSEKHAQAEESERRLTLAQADTEARRQAEADREEAAAYRERKRAEHPWFRERTRKTA